MNHQHYDLFLHESIYIEVVWSKWTLNFDGQWEISNITLKKLGMLENAPRSSKIIKNKSQNISNTTVNSAKLSAFLDSRPRFNPKTIQHPLPLTIFFCWPV